MRSRSGPFGVGIVGAGTISNTYLENLTSFPDTSVVAVADLIPEAARQKAEQFGVRRFGTVEALLADDDMDIVVNLTVPNAHAEVASQAVSAGKHVWNEKPLTVDRESAQALLKQADAAGRTRRLRAGHLPRVRPAARSAAGRGGTDRHPPHRAGAAADYRARSRGIPTRPSSSRPGRDRCSTWARTT